ncbi:MAG: urease accessory protein UreD [Dichotomicrobium sp.]
MFVDREQGHTGIEDGVQESPRVIMDRRAETTTAPFTRLQRSVGAARVCFKRRGARTVLADAYQSGCCKLRFPAPHSGVAPEAVLLNTAGGLTDGDRIATEARWRAGTRASVTTQAAERIYRSRGAPARIANDIAVEDGAAALWLPQETILFDGARLSRRLTADIAAGGRLLACESTVFGRAAMGETVTHGLLNDAWRVRYAGRLVFADGFRLEGDMRDLLARPAVAGGAAAVATVIYVGDDTEAIGDPLREMLSACDSLAGCSVIGPVLVARLLGANGAALRRDLVAVLQGLLRLLNGHKDNEDMTAAADLPRVWFC